jgi:phage gpG-like protein
MSAVAVQVNSANVRVSIGKLRLALQQNQELMKEISFGMLRSFQKTFRENGSPAGSWPALAPSTIKSDPAFYGAGHKLLIGHSHRLHGSVQPSSGQGWAALGSNLIYFGVHQFGSRDRGSVGIGPRTKAMQDATVNVKEHGYARLSASLGQGRIGNRVRNIAGPRNQVRIRVAGHTRHQNIPARPSLVFRPEDLQRIRSLVKGYIRRAIAAAGLGGA